MLPIVRVQHVKGFNMAKNVCLDNKGKEVVYDGIGYRFLLKNSSLSKNYSKAWN